MYNPNTTHTTPQFYATHHIDPTQQKLWAKISTGGKAARKTPQTHPSKVGGIVYSGCISGVVTNSAEHLYMLGGRGQVAPGNEGTITVTVTVTVTVTGHSVFVIPPNIPYREKQKRKQTKPQTKGRVRVISCRRPLKEDLE